MDMWEGRGVISEKYLNNMQSKAMAKAIISEIKK
jgi:hypothetical protein